MDELYRRYPALTACRGDIEAATRLLCDTFSHGGKLLLCGNGGSCADCEHIVGELMKGFLLPRPVAGLADRLCAVGVSADDAAYLVSNLQGALPAISLPHQSALLSSFSNDADPVLAYAQMVLGYGREGDLLLCLSTSGNSRNVVHAAQVARGLGMRTLALTGAGESRLSRLCDVTVRVPERETYRVQELHLPVYHALCAAVEEHFFGM